MKNIAESLCLECRKIELLPVRYALSSEENAACKKSPHLFDPFWKDCGIGEFLHYHLTLRILRERTFVYTLQFLDEPRPGDFRKYAAAPDLRVPVFYSGEPEEWQLFIACTSVEWTEAVKKLVLADPEKYMQKIGFSDGPCRVELQKNLHLADRLGKREVRKEEEDKPCLEHLVEEYMPSPHHLMSIRGFEYPGCPLSPCNPRLCDEDHPCPRRICDSEGTYWHPTFPVTDRTKEVLDSRWRDGWTPNFNARPSPDTPEATQKILDQGEEAALKSLETPRLLVALHDPVGMAMEFASLYDTGCTTIEKHADWYFYGNNVAQTCHFLVGQQSAMRSFYLQHAWKYQGGVASPSFDPGTLLASFDSETWFHPYIKMPILDQLERWNIKMPALDYLKGVEKSVQAFLRKSNKTILFQDLLRKWETELQEAPKTVRIRVRQFPFVLNKNVHQPFFISLEKSENQKHWSAVSFQDAEFNGLPGALLELERACRSPGATMRRWVTSGEGVEIAFVEGRGFCLFSAHKEMQGENHEFYNEASIFQERFLRETEILQKALFAITGDWETMLRSTGPFGFCKAFNLFDLERPKNFSDREDFYASCHTRMSLFPAGRELARRLYFSSQNPENEWDKLFWKIFGGRETMEGRSGLAPVPMPVEGTERLFQAMSMVLSELHLEALEHKSPSQESTLFTAVYQRLLTIMDERTTLLAVRTAASESSGMLMNLRREAREKGNHDFLFFCNWRLIQMKEKQVAPALPEGESPLDAFETWIGVGDAFREYFQAHPSSLGELEQKIISKIYTFNPKDKSTQFAFATFKKLGFIIASTAFVLDTKNFLKNHPGLRRQTLDYLANIQDILWCLGFTAAFAGPPALLFRSLRGKPFLPSTKTLGKALGKVAPILQGLDIVDSVGNREYESAAFIAAGLILGLVLGPGAGLLAVLATSFLAAQFRHNKFEEWMLGSIWGFNYKGSIEYDYRRDSEKKNLYPLFSYHLFFERLRREKEKLGGNAVYHNFPTDKQHPELSKNTGKEAQEDIKKRIRMGCDPKFTVYQDAKNIYLAFSVNSFSYTESRLEVKSEVSGDYNFSELLHHETREEKSPRGALLEKFPAFSRFSAAELDNLWHDIGARTLFHRKKSNLQKIYRALVESSILVPWQARLNERTGQLFWETVLKKHSWLVRVPKMDMGRVYWKLTCSFRYSKKIDLGSHYRTLILGQRQDRLIPYFSGRERSDPAYANQPPAPAHVHQRYLDLCGEYGVEHELPQTPLKLAASPFQEALELLQV